MAEDTENQVETEEVVDQEIEGDAPADDSSEEAQGDDTQDEGQADGEQEEVAQPAKAPKVNYVEEAKKEREARIRLEAQMEVLQRQPAAAPQPDYAKQEADRAEKERLSLMTPEEKERYTLSKEVTEIKNQLKHTQLLAQFNQADSTDRNNFVAKASDKNNPHAAIYSKHMASVEQKLNEFRKQGVYPTREEVLKLVLGDSILSSKPNVKARQAAKSRVESTQGKPTNVTNNSGPSSKKPASECSLDELRARIQSQKR